MFRHTGRVVGPPKNLNDLGKLEANLRVTCRTCGHEAILERDIVVRELRRRGRSLDWQLMPQNFRCSGVSCGSKDVKLAMVPFANGKARRELGSPVSLALRILHRSCDAARRRKVNTVEVRLALCVLQPFCAEASSLLTLWETSGNPDITLRVHGVRGAFDRIEQQLRQAGVHPGADMIEVE